MERISLALKLKQMSEESLMIPLQFRVIGKWNQARASILTLPHGPVLTPAFMPVGTQATIKGLTSKQVSDIGYRLILGNTYHLGLRPGAEIVEQLGGIHGFMNWPHNLLTDSGGFQMVSLSALANVTEEGVTFKSPVDGTKMLLTPEESMRIQNGLGADIMMALDDVIASTTSGDRVKEASERTIRWIDRCIGAHGRPETQNLYGIVQGGLDPELRRICLNALVERNLPGYAIGGLAGGEDKNLFWKVVHQCCELLPKDKPRYLMGVGYPLDLIICSALGVDQFDCVYPSRTARFGTALVPSGLMRLKSGIFVNDMRPIMEGCRCTTCQKFTRSYLHSIASDEDVLGRLITVHNLTYLFDLMMGFRQSVLDGSVDDYVRQFMADMFPDGEYPQWTKDALNAAKISI